ncbi:ABC transporter permease [Tuberibacillus sp. Marseille-P3662]|uniref:ABC transporter permease n=1 Tax=Tuberibacillus sp. Marseille-P3662 TaxID=1965358 RepID=UPI000A1CAEB7|nr:ABC transporter permease [Tuberibacillus sp. Marseille-P3662]
MMLRMFQADMLKMKRKWIWFLIFLGPFGVIALQGVNYGLRYDYLLNLYSNDWQGLIGNIQNLVPVTLLLGIAIVTSMIANIEHHQNSWKQLLALPVQRSVIYGAKFFVTVLMLLVSCLLLFLGSIILGIILDFGWTFSVIDLLKMSFMPLLAALPLLAFQLWLAITFKNQALALSIGILGAIFSMYTADMPDWVLWKWPLLQSEHAVAWYAIIGGMTGIIIFLIGMIDFTKRDVT